MYFNKFKKINYPFLINGKEVPITVTDITNNVRLKEKLKSLVTSYNYYTIANGETIELISKKLYGTEDYYWILMLLNDKYDYLTDFPIPMPVFDEYCRNKYGLNIDKVHHYESEIDGKFVTVSAPIPLPTIFSIVQQPVGYPNQTTIEYENYLKKMHIFNIQREIDQKYLNDNGPNAILPVTCDFPAIQRPANYPTESTVDYNFFLKKKESLDHQKALDDAYIAAHIVTNYQYETRVNDSKRELKYIPLEYIVNIADELKKVFK